jgi:uncharacterized membrane protein
LLPLIAAFFYALSSVFVKRGLRDGATMNQAFHINNIAVAVIFLPLAFLESQPINWNLWYWPVLTGIGFFFGGWLTFIAIQRGDVSLVTPLLGTKVVFVAIGSVVFATQSLSLTLWAAALLTSVGIFLIGFRDVRGVRHASFTAFITLASASLFGLCDVMLTAWASRFAPLTFLTISSLVVGLLTFVVWNFQGRDKILPAPGPRGWTVAGAVIVAGQAIMIGLALGFFNDATGINVVYASRGLWAVVLVYWFGKMLGNNERALSGQHFGWRFLGTTLVTVAVVMAVIERSQ